MTEPAPLPPSPAGAVDPAVPADMLILSEERLTVTTNRVPVGTVRIERYQVTETRTVTVDVLVDRIRVITTPDGQQPQVVDDPPADPNLADIHQGAREPLVGVESGEATGWLVLSEEQVVVSKQSVPVERIRLLTTTVTRNRTVTEQISAERLDRIHVGDATADGPAV